MVAARNPLKEALTRLWVQFHVLPRVPVLMKGMSGCASAAAIAGPEGTAAMGSKASPISRKVAFYENFAGMDRKLRYEGSQTGEAR